MDHKDFGRDIPWKSEPILASRYVAKSWVIRWMSENDDIRVSRVACLSVPSSDQRPTDALSLVFG
jgi:hypothetical protein